MRGRSIQKSDSSREEAVLESVGTSDLCIFFPMGEGGEKDVQGVWGP